MPRFDPQKEFRLRVMAEYGSSGIWGIGLIGPYRRGMVEHEWLRLPVDLSWAFIQWIDWYYKTMPDSEGEAQDIEKYYAAGLPLSEELKGWISWYWDNVGGKSTVFDTEKFNAEGLRLARELKIFLGDDVYVEFLPELESGGLGEPQEIRLDT
jgi:hypothetical protein